MPDHTPIAPDLLARYLAGQATPAEREEVERWRERPENRRELERLQAIWQPAPADPSWDVDRAWQRVAGRLDREPAVVRRRAFGVPAPVLALAATILLVIGAAWVWTGRRPEPPAPVTYATQAGERREVELPDGTRIVLAPGTELSVAGDYGRGSRRVDLQGEAWFEVEHDAARPFLVHAAGTITEDIGTEFLVQVLPADSGVRVALVSGSASLRRVGEPAGAAVVLAPDDIGLFAPGDATARVERGASLDALVAWHEGRLEFEDARLVEVATAITRWYGIPVLLADGALAERRFTGTLRLDALDGALEVLRLSLGVQTERRADTLVVR